MMVNGINRNINAVFTRDIVLHLVVRIKYAAAATIWFDRQKSAYAFFIRMQHTQVQFIYVFKNFQVLSISVA